MRIASLLASATEIVCALGLDDALVAISHECDYPAHVLDRPRVSRPRFDPTGLSGGAIDAAVRGAVAEYGSVYVLDEEALREAAPDLILTQDVCEVCAVPTSLAHQAVRALGGATRVLSLLARLGHDTDGDGYISDEEAKWAGWKQIRPAIRRAITVDGETVRLAGRGFDFWDHLPARPVARGDRQRL